MSEKKKLRCGLVMPISAIDGCSEGHWEEVRLVIKEALNDTNFEVEVVSDSNEVGIIQKRIVQNIYDNDMVVCDVSAKNPNVMFELGMRLAFDKPAIIIKDDKTNYSFDTSPIEHITYPRDLHYHTIQLFKTKLKDKVIATYAASLKPEYTTFLKHFGQFVVANIEEKKVGKDEYLLSAVGELRAEVSALGRTMRHRDEPRNKLAEFMYPQRGRGPISESDFILSALAQSDSPEYRKDLADPESPLFKRLVTEFLNTQVPPNIAMKERHASTIARNLHKHAVELLNS
ncbi:MAG TPA: hypothetical protein VIK56_11455 [Rhodoferax sp.]